MTSDKKNSLIIWLIIVLVLAGLIGQQIYAKNKKTADFSPDKISRLAQCLTEKGVKIYGAFWCGHCQNQKKAFGSAWSHINYIECSNPDGSQTEECQKDGIQGYPIWDFGNGARLSGEIPLEELAKKTGCAY